MATTQAAVTTPSEPTMDVFSPDGQHGTIPISQWSTAQRQGFHVAVSVTSPDGQGGWVPSRQTGEALKQGFKLGPPQQQNIRAPRQTDNPELQKTLDRYGLSGSLPTQEDMSGYVSADNSGPSFRDTAKKFGGEMLTSLRKVAFYKPSAGESAAHYEPLEGTAAAMIKSGTQAVQQAKKGEYGRATVSALSSIDPFAAGPVSQINELEDSGRSQEAEQRGILNIAALAAPKVPSVIRTAADSTSLARVPAATRAAFTRTAAQALGSAVKPENLGAFQNAAAVAMPRIQAAARARGVTSMTLDGALDSIGQAKEDLLMEHQSSLAEGQHLGELHPAQAAELNRHMEALNTLQRELQAAKQRMTTEAKGRRTAAADAARIDSRIDRAFSKIRNSQQQNGPESFDQTAQRVFSAQPGDLTVRHESVIFPPEQPHGDAKVIPVRNGRIPLADQRGIQAGRPPIEEPAPLYPATERTARPRPGPLSRTQPPPQSPRAPLALGQGAIDLPEHSDSTLVSRVEQRRIEATAATPEQQWSDIRAYLQRNPYASPQQIQQAVASAIQQEGILPSDKIPGGDVETGVARNTNQGKRLAPQRQVRPPRAGVVDQANNLSPDPYASFPRPMSGEAAATHWLAGQNLNTLEAIAQRRGIKFSRGGDQHATLISKIVDSMTESELQELEAASIERSRFPREPQRPAQHAELPLNIFSPRKPRALSSFGKVVVPGEPENDLSGILRESVNQIRRSKGQPPLTDEDAGSGSIMSDPIRIGRAERRQNFDFRAQVESMNPEDRARAIFISDKTGLPNYRAFQQSKDLLSESHPHVGYADIDDFKRANDALGHQGVDEKILPLVGEVMRQAAREESGAVHVFHRSGDEFLFRAEDPAAVRRVVNRANNILKDAIFEIRKPDGSTAQVKGVGLSHGTGTDEATAEAAADADKTSRKAAGLRAGDRDAEARNLGRHPSGQQVNSREAAERQGILRPQDLKRGDVGYVHPNDIKLVPNTFQYKQFVNEMGVTNQFAGSKFNEDLAGIVHTFKDPETGELAAVNGHHRVELAQRSAAPRVLTRVMDTDNPVQARALGALQNIAEGQGTAFDAGMFLKDSKLTPGDLKKMGISLTAQKVEAGMALKNLDRSILEKVGTGQISEGRGVALGKATSDPVTQQGILDLIAKREAAGKQVSDSTVAEMARIAEHAGNYSQDTLSLFGPQQKTNSLLLDVADVSAYVKRSIIKERNTFGSVASESKAEALARAGNKISTAENQRISREAAQAAEVYDKMSLSKGPINDALVKAARRLRDGEDARAVKEEAYKQIREEISSSIPGGQKQGGRGATGDATGGSGDQKTN